MSYLLIKRCKLHPLNVKYSNPKNRALWLTRLKFSAIIYSYKRDEKNILSGIYNLIFSDTRKSLFGGMLKPPPTNLQVQLINNKFSVSSTELIFSTFFSQFNTLVNMTNEPIFLRFPQVIERTSFSKSTINRREKEGKFPKRIKWGNIVFWNSYEIEKFQKDPNGYFVGGTK